MERINRKSAENPPRSPDLTTLDFTYRVNSVGKETGYEMESRGSIPCLNKVFSLFHIVETGYGA